MKHKFLVVLMAIVAALCMAFGLSACGEQSFKTEGTYYLIDGNEMDKKNYFTLHGGKWTDGEGFSGDYEIDGEKITLYTDLFGAHAEFTSGTIKNGILTLKAIYADKIYAQEGAWDSTSGSSDNSFQTSTEYTVTYNANGGAFSDGQNTYTQTVKAGNKLTAPTSPVRSNYSFAGWAKSKSGSAMWKFDEDTVSQDVTLFAQWTQESAIILSVEGASIEEREIFMLVDHTTGEVSLSGKVVCSDDSIWRLYSDPEGQREIPTKMVTNLKNGNNKYYIVVNSQNQAQVNVYELTVHRSFLVNVSYYNGESLLETAETYTGDTFTAEYKPEITGYTFNGWKTNDGGNFISDVLWSPLSLYVDKTAKTYKVTLDVNNGDPLTETEKTVTYDSEYSFPVPTRTGYSFMGWYVGNTQVTNTSGESLSAWNFAKGQNLLAYWHPNKYKVTLNVNNKEAGTVTGGGDHDYDSQVTITANTNSGFTWLGWYKGNEKVSSDFSYNFKMGFAVTYTAKWIECPVTLVKDVPQGGSVSGVEQTIAGAETTITAKTNNGYTWLGWYQGGQEITREFTYKFTMPDSAAGAITYTAKWIRCPVTVQSSDTTIGTVSGFPQTTTLGQTITVEATSSALGGEWLGWYNGENRLTESYAYTFELGQEQQNLTAKYQVKADIQNFEFISDETTCTITGVKNKELNEFAVPEYVTAIKIGAFSGCSSIQSITLPFVGGSRKTSKDTYQYPFGYIFGISGFSGASAVKQYYYGKSTSSSTSTTYYIPDSLKNVIITDGEILFGAFTYCDRLTSITIPDSVTSIGDYAFQNCDGLTSITIPDSVTSIGDSAFLDCDGLTSIVIPDSVTSIGDRAFAYCDDLTSITIESGVTSIGKEAFYGCRGLTSITIPDSVTSIGAGAFSDCSGLTGELKIPDSVTSIGDYVFNRIRDTAKNQKILLKQSLSRA